MKQVSNLFIDLSLDSLFSFLFKKNLFSVSVCKIINSAEFIRYFEKINFKTVQKGN